MSSKNLQALKVVHGNDMSPCIDPAETLYLDSGATPEVGDVVLFRNKFGIRVAHRLMFKFAGFYYTRGDNCPIINFPFTKDKLLGVIVGKGRPVRRSMFAEALLALLVPQFLAYSSVFDIRKKKYFLLQTLASRHYPYTKVG